MQITEKIGISLIAILIAFLIWHDCSLLFQTQIPVGIDGYYYILQVESLLKAGRLYFTTKTPLVLYFLAALSIFTNNHAFALKIGAVILQILLCLGVGAVLKLLTKRICFAVLGVFLIEISPLHLYFLSEFLKGLGSIVFLIWSLFAIIKTSRTKEKIWPILSILLLVAACFSHPSTCWLILMTLSFSLLARIWLNLKNESRALFTAVFLVLFAVPSVLSWQAVFALPDVFRSEFLRYPENPFKLFTFMDELMLSLASIFTMAIFMFRPNLISKGANSVILLVIVIWTCLVTLNPFLNHEQEVLGITGRLDAFAFLLAAIATPLFIFTFFNNSRNAVFLTILIIILIAFGRWFTTEPVGLRRDYLQTREQLVKALPLMKKNLCSNPMIIAAHGDQFAVSAILNVASQHLPPLDDTFQCTYWLIHQPDKEFQFIFTSGATSLDGRFSLVSDYELRTLIQTMPTEEKTELISENPHLRILITKSTR